MSYTDTPDVEAQRIVLEQYNAFMAEQDVQMPAPFGFMRDVFITRRTFIDESWQLGGRLFGGGFQQLSKAERKRITINGEPVVELDVRVVMRRWPSLMLASTGTPSRTNTYTPD